MTDLYQTLGIDRGASKADIRKAYRRRAKAAHPDAGGSTESFNRLHTALVVLSDDARRQKYDTTGEFDEGNVVDNTLASTLEMMSVILDLALGNIGRSQRDPRQVDLLWEMRQALSQSRQKDAEEARAVQRAKEIWSLLAGRFTRKEDGPNYFENMISGTINQLAIRLAKFDERKKWLDAVEAMLDDYQYRSDQPAMQEGLTSVRLADMMNRALGMGSPL